MTKKTKSTNTVNTTNTETVLTSKDAIDKATTIFIDAINNPFGRIFIALIAAYTLTYIIRAMSQEINHVYVISPSGKKHQVVERKAIILYRQGWSVEPVYLYSPSLKCFGEWSFIQAYRICRKHRGWSYLAEKPKSKREMYKSQKV